MTRPLLAIHADCGSILCGLVPIDYESGYNLWSIKPFRLGVTRDKPWVRYCISISYFVSQVKILLANIWWGSWCWCQEVDITMCRVSQSYHIIIAIYKHSVWFENFAGMEFWWTLFNRMIQRFSSAVQLSMSWAWCNVTILHSGSALIHFWML